MINRAQAYKWSGDESRSLEILNNEDFSAVNNLFKLADYVLRDRFTEALELIKQIGSDGKVTSGDYREWPLFQRLREHQDFESVIVTVFGPTQRVELPATGPSEENAVESEPISEDSALTPREAVSSNRQETSKAELEPQDEKPADGDAIPT